MKNNWNKYKKHIPIICLILFMCIYIVFVYNNSIINVVRESGGPYFTSDIFEGNRIELTDTKIIQEYTTTRAEISYLGLALRREGDVSNMVMHIVLRDKESRGIIQQWDLSPEALSMSGTFDNLRVGNKLIGDRGKVLQIELSVDNPDEKGKVEVCLSTSSKHYGDLTVNGEKNSGCLALAIYGPLPYVGKLFWIIAAGFVIVVCLLYTLFKQTNIKLESAFLILFVFLGGVYLILFTPLTEPDSTAHVATVYYNTNELLGKTPSDEDGKVIVRREDYEADGLTHLLGMDNLNTVKEQMFSKADLTMEETLGRGSLGLPFFVYLPQTIGIILGILTGAGAVLTLYLGKILAMLFYMICCYWAIKLIPFGKMIMVYIALLPFSLEMATSFSYDCEVLALSFLMIGYGFYLIYEKKQVGWKDILLWLILTLWLTPCKVVYGVITALIFMVPKEKFRKKRFYYITCCASAGIAILSLGISRFSSVAASISKETADYFTLEMVLEDLPEFMLMIGRTIIKYTDSYLFQMFGGNYSWMDVGLPAFVVVLYIVLMLCVSVTNVSENIFVKNKDRIAIGSICLIVIAGIAAALLLSWTPKDSNVIEGIQGRYFLPILPLILFAARNKIITFQKKMDNHLFLSIVVLQFFTVLQLYAIIITR